MRLRVIAGDGIIEAPKDSNGLQILYQKPGLLIQGTADVVSIDAMPRKVFLGGELLGVRTRAGELRSPTAGEGELRGLAGPLDVRGWRDAVDGRYVAVTVDDDGRCEIGADRFGRLDLYYQRAGGRTIIGTDLDLLPVSQGSVKYDQAALAHASCAYGWRPPKRHTLYQDVRRLGVGQTASIANGSVSFTDATFAPVAVAPYGEREHDEYADILLGAIGASGSRHGNVVYLSSGWDSTSILACLVRLFGARKVRAVIGRMRYSERSGVINQFELDRAKAVAEYYGVRLDIAEFDISTAIPPVFDQLQPLMRPNQLAAFTLMTHGILADFVARTTPGDETVFAGEISDGAHNLGFSQFATIFHPVLEFREYSDKMGSYLFGPNFLRTLWDGQAEADPIYTLFRQRAGGAVFDAPGADRVARSRQLLASFFLRGSRLPLLSLQNSRMLTEAGRRLYSAEMEEAYLRRAAEELTPETLYAWYLHLYNSFHWQGSTVATMAVTAAARGLRLALPFWDTRLQEFLSAMPESWGRGLDLNPTKFPLKWMLKHRVDYPMHLQVGPHSYLYDVDPEFSHGAEALYRSAFTPYFKERLKSRRYRALFGGEAFDLGYLDSVVDRYLAGSELKGAEMGDLVTLCYFSTAGWYGDGR